MSVKMGPGGNGVTGGRYRFRFDDGGEVIDGSEANWRADINTEISLPINADKFRLRFAVQRLDSSAIIQNFTMGQSLNGGPFSVIRTTTTNISKLVASAFVASRDDTTQYSGSNQVFEGTWIDDDNSGFVGDFNFHRTGQINWPGDNVNNGFSMEFTIKLITNGPTFTLEAGDTIEFRPYINPFDTLTGGWPRNALINLTEAVIFRRIFNTS